MKLLKTFFILIILLVSFQISFGQEKPEPILVDEFGNIPCDEFLGRTDNFLAVLQKNPDSQGYAVISGTSYDLRRKVGFELMMKGAMTFRNFDSSRISFVRSADTDKLIIQFWSVLQGAEKPDFNESEWSFVFPPQTKPFLFFDNAFFEICPSSPFETIYAEYLNANLQARGHVVIYTKSLKEYKKLKKDTLKLLKDIPISRLRFFHVKKEHSDNYANIEYWLVPRKIK